MDLEEIGINAGNWVDSAEDRIYWRALVMRYRTSGFHKPRSQLVVQINVLTIWANDNGTGKIGHISNRIHNLNPCIFCEKGKKRFNRVSFAV